MSRARPPRAGAAVPGLGGRGRRLLVHLHDRGQMDEGEPIASAKHGERDLPGCGLAFQPALLDPQDLGDFLGGIQRWSALAVTRDRQLRPPVLGWPRCPQAEQSKVSPRGLASANRVPLRPPGTLADEIFGDTNKRLLGYCDNVE